MPVVTYSDSVDSELIGVCLRARLLTECHFVLFLKNGYCWRSLILLQRTLRTNKSICTYAENPILIDAVCVITPRGRKHDHSLFVFYCLRFVLAVHIIIIQAFGAGLRMCVCKHMIHLLLHLDSIWVDIKYRN